jgi:hypothetical protein
MRVPISDGPCVNGAWRATRGEVGGKSNWLSFVRMADLLAHVDCFRVADQADGSPLMFHNGTGHGPIPACTYAIGAKLNLCSILSN